jgi:serine/threonine-protein kinase
MVDHDDTDSDAKVTLERASVTIPRDAARTEVQSEPTNISEPDIELVPLRAEERYERVTMLGEGGMGVVRLCRDRHIGREIAVKRVKDEHLTDRVICGRLLREARIQGQLEHPSIVPVYDLAVGEAGETFFTMRRVRGQTLEEIIDRLRVGDLDTARDHSRHSLLAAFIRVCLAVEFAHARGVLHRDLKPSNIMLGKFGEVYALDWGLATLEKTTIRTAGDRPTWRVEVDVGAAETRHGAVIGTPLYLAPECLEGVDSDRRSDIYALGAILFEILTLEPLHGSGTVKEIFERVRKGVDGCPSRRAPAREIPPELDAVCMHATARDPMARHTSARDLADAIERYLSGDRDIELRKKLAREHIANARTASQRGLADESRALREAGRALALTPDDPEALELLAELLTKPPSVPPPEVVEKLTQTERDAERGTFRRAALAMVVGWLLVLPPWMVILGVNDAPLVALCAGVWLVAAAVWYLAYLGYDRFGRQLRPLLMALTLVALTVSSVMHGPFLVLPVIATIFVAVYVQSFERYSRLSVFLAILAVVVPSVLVIFDMHPVHYAFTGGAMSMSGGALALPRVGTLVFFTLAHVGLIAVVAIFVAVLRRTRADVDYVNAVRAWKLRQLAPASWARSPHE